MPARPNSGPKPTPTVLKVVRGNPGRRPLPDDEPARIPNLPKPPRELSLRCKREWKRMGKELVDAGLLTNLDRMGFAALVTSYVRWLEATEGLNQTGMLINTRNGPALNPLLKVARDAQSEYTRMLTEFGLTPSAAVRVHGKKQEEDDPFEAFMKKRAK